MDLTMNGKNFEIAVVVIDYQGDWVVQRARWDRGLSG